MPRAEGHLAARGGLTQHHHRQSRACGGSLEDPRHLSFSCHEGHRPRVSGCPPPAFGCLLTLATKAAPRPRKKLPTTWGHCGTRASANTLFSPPADETDDSGSAPTAPVGKAPSLVPLEEIKAQGGAVTCLRPRSGSVQEPSRTAQVCLTPE